MTSTAGFPASGNFVIAVDGEKMFVTSVSVGNASAQIATTTENQYAVVTATTTAAHGFAVGQVVTIAGVTYLLLPRAGQVSVLRWASTNVHNLHQDPVGCLVASAFFPSVSVGAWPLLIALALFGANRVLGNWRTLAVGGHEHAISAAPSSR